MQWSMSSTVTTGIAAVATAVALSSIMRMRRRRRRLGRGEIGELSDRWVTVDGCRVYARGAGGFPGQQRLPVVLVHGFGVSSSYFVPTAKRLASEFRVYAPDLPGHGKSATPREPCNIPRFADALVGWMDTIGIRRAALVGNSMGCQIAVETAVRYPDRVDRLVLIAPTVDPAHGTVHQLFGRLLVGALYERFSLSGLLVKDYTRMAWRLIPELHFMLSDRIEEKLPQVSHPVMLVRGEKDPIVPQRWFDEAARLVRAQQIAVIPGWGHAVNYSAAGPLTDAIVPFLRMPSQKRGLTGSP